MKLAPRTCFYGGGSDADVSATALATYAILLYGGNNDTADKALAYLAGTRDSMGNLGSTQATIWTLRALLLAASKGTEGAVGSLDVAVDGAEFTTLALTADQADVMTTVDLSTLATTGSHEVALTFVGTGKVSYNLVAQHNVLWGSDPGTPGGPLSISVSYDKTSLVLDETATVLPAQAAQRRRSRHPASAGDSGIDLKRGVTEPTCAIGPPGDGAGLPEGPARACRQSETRCGDAKTAFGFPARVLPLVFGRPLSYKIQVKGRCEDLEECK